MTRAALLAILASFLAAPPAEAERPVVRIGFVLDGESSVNALTALVRQEILTLTEGVDEALAAIPADAEAVYLAPLLHFSDDERRRFVAGLNDRDLPTFSAASALYDFFIDLIDVERSINWFNFLHTPQESQDWYQRLEKWFADHNLEPRPELVRFWDSRR